LITSPSFDTFRTASNRAKGVVPFEGTLLSLDPGETTGYAIFVATKDSAQLFEAGQLKTWPLDDCIAALDTLLDKAFPTRQSTNLALFESYNVYAHKLEQHTHSSVPTVQIIGSLKTLLILRKQRWITQTAQVGKGFAKDEKLQKWGFYLEGKKHARDATRHGCYFLLFGHSEL